MRAPTLPGSSQDVFNGACPSCSYFGRGLNCERRYSEAFQQGLAPPAPAVASPDLPLENDCEQRRTSAAPKASDPPHPEDHNPQKNRAPSVSAVGNDSQGPKYRFQDMAINFARRARALPSEEQQGLLTMFESLLATKGLELDVLNISRCVLELPVEERAETAEMMIQILRLMLGSKDCG